MATLNVKNFPDRLYRKLRARAKRERRSLAQEVTRILKQSVEGEKTLDIRELEGLGKELWQGIDPVEYIRAERDSWERDPEWPR
jgi:plasmid stability protein